MLQTWKCKDGSLVHAGESIAIARPATDSDDSRSSNASQMATTDAASRSSHKRPNRRRRPTPATTPSVVKADISQPPSAAGSETDSKNAIASIQERLASKLSSDKSVTGGGKRGESSPPPPSTSSKGSVKQIVAPMTGILKLLSSEKKEAEATHNKLCIGYIEECSHPTLLEGICVVCGISMTQRGQNEDNREGQSSPSIVPVPSAHLLARGAKTSRVTVSGGVTMTVSADEGQKLAKQHTDRLLQQAKLSLVLDLDHTLVHATADPRAQQFHDKDDVRTLRLPLMEGAPNHAAIPHGPPVFMQHFVKLRPHLRNFLKSVQPDYELTVYTAGTRQYAEEITIVLCRHVVGSTLDIGDLERMRYHVHMARLEYQKLKSLDDIAEKSAMDVADKGNGVDGNDSKSGEPAVKKRKVVSFGAPPSNNEGWGGESSGAVKSSARSDHMTKEKLVLLEAELEKAEELEKRAWDLRQKLFGSRVVSRTDVGDLGRDVKSLRRIFPCGGTMTAVVDDREDVWANAVDNSVDTIKGEPPSNLLLVRPYHWQPFSGFADVNNAAGEDLSGGQDRKNEDPSEEKDVQLVWTSRILKGLHRRYYRQDISNRKSVPELLAQMRTQVLKDATIVLSGLVPLHKKVLGTHQTRPPIIRYAQSLGANVSCFLALALRIEGKDLQFYHMTHRTFFLNQLVDDVSPGVTHVVASRDGTDKCLSARKTPGCVLVKAAWLVECYWSMTRRDTESHMFASVSAKEVSQRIATPGDTSTIKASKNDTDESEGEDDGVDDEFAASFEMDF